MKITEHFSFGTGDQIACPCCDRIKTGDLFDISMGLLEDLRQLVGPLIVNCGYRCEYYNCICNLSGTLKKKWIEAIPNFASTDFRKEVIETERLDSLLVGAPSSMHLEFAVDIRPPFKESVSVNTTQLNNIYFEAKQLGFSGIGKYNTFIHLDCRHILNRAHASWDYRSE